MSEEAETNLIEEQEEAILNEEVTENTEVNADAEVSDEKPKQSRSQDTKARLRRKLREEQEARIKLEEYNRKQQERLDALEQKVEGVVNPPAKRPARIDFDTEEEYEDALFDFRSQKQAPVAETSPVPATQEPPKVNYLPDDVQENWDNQLDAANEKYEDFNDVMESIKPETMTDTMANAIFESDTGGEVAYFLGKNPREADRISRLSVTAQIRAIDKLGGEFTKNTTNAPDPISPIKGKGDVNGKTVDPLLEGATFT